MSSTIKLPSGKLIDLSRFVALLEDDDSTKSNYQLSLDGLSQTINIDATDAEFISHLLESQSDKNSSHSKADWDKEAQLRKNQPLMKLIEQWQKQKNGKPATESEIQEYQEIQESLKRNRFIEQTS